MLTKVFHLKLLRQKITTFALPLWTWRRSINRVERNAVKLVLGQYREQRRLFEAITCISKRESGNIKSMVSSKA